CTSSSTRSMLRRLRARMCIASTWLRAGPTNSCSGMKRRHSSRYLSSSSMIRIDDTSRLPDRASVQAAMKITQLQADVLLGRADRRTRLGQRLAVVVDQRRPDALEPGDRSGHGFELGLERLRQRGQVSAPHLPGRLAAIAVLAG